ncbi:MAG TPA: homoserine kinase [Casimicrobiaceae bacterium]|jgi:homoserine kinase type II
MSVYTTVSTDDLDAWLARYNVGRLAGFTPIVAGIENSNYFVTTEFGQFVLTLYERLPADELPFYLNLTAHLARCGVPVPAPEPDRTGALFSILNGKPASLVRRVSGVPAMSPSNTQRAAAGEALARLHLASTSYRARLTNRRGPAWWRQAARAVKPFLTPAQNEFLAGEIRFQVGYGKDKLPKGAVHGDLFRDNVLFEGTRVAGIIDFGFAATDYFAYDLAVTVNDWCSDAAGALDADGVAALVGAYDKVRALGADERAQWPALLRAAALRFWLSRLYDLHLPRPGALTHAHDPAEYERMLRHRAAQPPRFPAITAGAARDARS